VVVHTMAWLFIFQAWLPGRWSRPTVCQAVRPTPMATVAGVRMDEDSQIDLPVGGRRLSIRAALLGPRVVIHGVGTGDRA